MLYIEEKWKFTHNTPTQLSLPRHTPLKNDTVAINLLGICKDTPDASVSKMNMMIWDTLHNEHAPKWFLTIS